MMFMNVFWVLILISGLYFLATWLGRRPEALQPNALLPGTSSIDILKERYARGEVDRAEFERIKRDLTEA